MMAGIPALVSTSPPLARTVENAKAGLVFNAGDDKDLADKIVELIQRSDKEEWGANGYRYAVTEGNNWEDEAAALMLRMYREIFDSKTAFQIKRDQ